jgi:hypothetical protein
MRGSMSKAVLLFAVALLLCIPLGLFHDSPAEGAASPRGEFLQDGAAVLGFDNETFQNLSFGISLPSNSTIRYASVDLEGLPVIGPKTGAACDFNSDTKDYVAYAGTYSKNAPGSAKPSAFQGNQLASGELGKIAFLDQTYSEQYAYSWNGEYGYHHFKFKVPLDIIDDINVIWAGYSGYYYKSGTYTYGGYGTASAYVWNNVSLAWEYVGNVTGAPKSVTKWFNGSDYVDDDGFVHVLSLTKSGWQYYSGYAYNNMDTDYVRVCATGNILLYPKDPLMDIGANGRVEWSLKTDEFSTQVTVQDSTLITELQSLVRNQPGRHTAIKFRFRSSEVGFLRVSNLTVWYNAPPWCRGIPDTYMLDEDTPAPKLIDLDRFFEDDSGTLRYELIYEEDAKKLDAELNSDGRSLDFRPAAKNWWGRLSFKVRATDADDAPLTRESNMFYVTVKPVNDPPVLATPARQLAVEKTPFRLTVTARDVDMELDPAEKLTFWDNSSLFDIDADTGAVAFTPRQDQVGVYAIQVGVTDAAGASDRRNFTLEIQDAEDPPAMGFIPDQEAVQDQPFRFKASASDPDIPYGDWVNFTDDCPLFVIGTANGLIEFTPTVKDIGKYYVTVTVTDKAGASDLRRFNLTVLNTIGNTDRPPSIEAVANQTAVEGQAFSLQLKASDPDIPRGDALAFSDDSALFEVDQTGRISFTPEFKDAGWSNVTVTVRDRDGLEAKTTFQLRVLSVNHAPVIVALNLADGSNHTTGAPIKLMAAATDLDGDGLNFSWKEGGIILGHGDELTVSFEESRTYFITLAVSDGNLETTREVSLVVLDPPLKKGLFGTQGAPGFEGRSWCWPWRERSLRRCGGDGVKRHPAPLQKTFIPLAS